MVRRWLPALVVALPVSMTTATLSGQTVPLVEQLRDLVGIDLFGGADPAPDLVKGEPFVTELPTSEATEVALAGVVWIPSPPERYLSGVSAISPFEHGGAVGATHRLADEPTADDLADMTLPLADLATLKTCRAGNCELRLDDATITQLEREVDWTSPQASVAANDILRQFVLRLVRSYVANGDSGLPVFHDKERPVAAADQFARLLTDAVELSTPDGDLHRYFVDYPRASLPEGGASFLYWQIVEFGLKPVLRVNHLVVWPRGSLTIIASRLLYASHYFWTALETRFLIVDAARPGGFYLASVERSRSDGLTGWSGTLIGGTLRSHARQALAGALRDMRDRLSAQH